MKRKFIREARDFWYELCARSVALAGEELKAISTALERVATKEDIARLSIQNTSYVSASRRLQRRRGSTCGSRLFGRSLFTH